MLFSRSPAYYRTHKYIHVPGDCDSCNGSDSGSGFPLSLHPVHRKRCYTSRTSGSLPPTVRIKTSGNHRTFSQRCGMFLLPSPKPLLIFPGTYMRSRSDNPAHMHTPLPFRQDGFFPDPRRLSCLKIDTLTNKSHMRKRAASSTKRLSNFIFRSMVSK